MDNLGRTSNKIYKENTNFDRQSYQTCIFICLRKTQYLVKTLAYGKILACLFYIDCIQTYHLHNTSSSTSVISHVA